MKLETKTVERIFLPLITTLVASGVASLFHMYTQIKVLETKVDSNHERISAIFKKIDELKKGQDDILRLLIGWDKDH